MCLIKNAKSNELHKITMICRPCDKAVRMDTCTCKVIKADEFDTYMFRCPHCNNAIRVVFDHKDGTTTQTHETPLDQL